MRRYRADPATVDHPGGGSRHSPSQGVFSAFVDFPAFLRLEILKIR
jgi:hypothetical protein